MGITTKGGTLLGKQMSLLPSPPLPPTLQLLRLDFEALAVVQLGLQTSRMGVQTISTLATSATPSSIAVFRFPLTLCSTARNTVSRYSLTYLCLIIFLPTQILSHTCQSCTSLHACYCSVLLSRVPNPHPTVLLSYSNSALFDLSRFTRISH